MSSSTDILTLYREFTEALTEVLAENAVGPARRISGDQAHSREFSEDAYKRAAEPKELRP